MLMLEDAIELAVKAHKGQKDLSGKAYILHPLRVMHKMDTDAERIVAILHDVTEDTEYTIGLISNYGLTEEMRDAIVILDKNNHPKTSDIDYDYQQMIIKIKKSPLAKKVKIADLEDNMDIKRIIGREGLTQKDKNRLAKYLKAWSFLTGE